MSRASFFRVLNASVDGKAIAILSAITAHNNGEMSQDGIYLAEVEGFSQIPGTPFAYWTPDSHRRIFKEHPPLEQNERIARIGDHPGNKDRYVRLFWEVVPSTRQGIRQWLPYQKGGIYSPYYCDLDLVVDWDLERESYYDFYGRPGRTSERPSNYQYFLRPGLSWPLRTNGLSVRVLPRGCVISNKGPTVYVKNDSPTELLKALAVMNSQMFSRLLEYQLARTELAQSFEVGLIQQTPVPDDLSALDTTLVLEAHVLTRGADQDDETTHAFGRPGLADLSGRTLLDLNRQLIRADRDRLRRLVEIQQALDEQVFDLYGLSPAERDLTRAEVSHPHLEGVTQDEDASSGSENLPLRVQNLLMWCAGVAYGRWDARFALNPDLLPALQGPFDPLPRVAPGGLVGPDGLPATRESISSETWLAARENVLHIPDLPLPDGAPTITPAADYPLPVAWDGILVDDPTHPSDIVGRVRDVLGLLWGDRAGAIEQEACDILGVNGLRDYFRDPRNGFFAFHIKRYSKSRRKAPIYWLLQSANRNYAIWLYIHRMDDQTYFAAARDYADAKVNLEAARLDELHEGLSALSGSAQKRRERDIEQQEKLVDEVTTFRNTLDKIALLGLPPDLNDGVVLGIAPLHELVPWKEADKYWQALLDGEYEWSTMAQRMRERGLVK